MPKHKVIRITRLKHRDILVIPDNDRIILCIGKRDYALSFINAKELARYILEVCS